MNTITFIPAEGTKDELQFIISLENPELLLSG